MRAILIANGEIADLQGAKEQIQPEDLIIAVDGGALFCQVMGLLPDILIGDLDSLSQEEVDDFQKKGVKILRFDPRKDETDLELALLHALSLGASEAIVLGGLGRRWDHSLANLLIPAHPALSKLQVSFWNDGESLHILKDSIAVKDRNGATLSLIPIGGDAEGVTTQGLEWPLENEPLRFGASRGVSNRIVGENAKIEIKKGLLLCIIGSKD